jgi:hypothetical protein
VLRVLWWTLIRSVMSPRRVRLAGLFLCCASFAGCANVVSDMDFRPPPGWVWAFTPPYSGRQVWIDPRDPLQIVMVMRPGQPANMSTGLGVRRTNIKICGNHPAVYYTIDTSPLLKQNAQMEWVDTWWSGHPISAAYTRRAGTAPDVGAEKAIRSLCMSKG